MRLRLVLACVVLAWIPVPGEVRAREAADAGELSRLVWEAVDAAEADLSGVLDRLRSRSGTTWREVYEVLSMPRPAGLLIPIAPPRAYRAEDKEHLESFPWEPGVVKAYDIGDDQSFWYSVTLPPDPHPDPATPVAVLLDLGAFAPQAAAPPGWAVVRFSDYLYLADDLGGVPFSLTAGTASQCALLTVLEDLERHLRFDPDRVFVAGFSRGGNAALYFGVHWPDLFAGIVPAAGYYDVEDRFLDNLDHVAVLAAHGDDRGHRAANAYQKALVRRLEESGGDVTERAQEGRATDGSFGPDFLAWAASRRRTALPRSFRYTLRDPRHRGAYWAEILEVKRTGRERTVRIGAMGGGVAETFKIHRRESMVGAEVTGDNEVRLLARNVKRLRLRLSPELFDLDQDLTIRYGSRTFTQSPTPSIETLIRSFRRRHDRSLLFPAFVDVSL